MPKQNAPIVSFNHGLVSRLALARVDLARLKFAAETQTNWTPRTVGPMMLRPGLEFVGNTKNDAATEIIPFVFSNTQTALIEITGSAARLWIDEELVTRASVATAVTSGDFGASTGWTLSNATIAGGVLNLAALTLGSTATATQTVTVSSGDKTTEHGMRINVDRGPVRFRIGTTSGDDDVMNVASLGVGEHSLAFTPGATTIYIQFESTVRRAIVVNSCQIDSAGVLQLTSPWATADFADIRYAQSGDVVFIACDGYQQRKFERRSETSWSLVTYQTEDGPFQPIASARVLITPSDTKGNIVLAAATNYFSSDMVGMLLHLFQTAQERTASIAAEDTFMEPIRVAGISGLRNGSGNPVGIVVRTARGSRTFKVTITGTWVGTVSLQRSFDSAESGFSSVRTYTANKSENITDEFDNSVVWYRLGFEAGDYTSGTATVTLAYPGGGSAGVVRFTSVASPTSAEAEVLDELSSLSPTRDWQEGEWSDRRGYPTAVAVYEGRLWWFGRDRIWGSISDAYENFDNLFEGEAGPVMRSIGYGPVEVINWALPMQRLLLGLQGSEAEIRSSATDEPISPVNFSIKDVSTQGSAAVAAVKVDSRGIFIHKSKRRVFQLLYMFEENNYRAVDLTALIPDIDSNLVKVAVQRQPDTRIHVVRADGDVIVLVFEPSEEVICWYRVETDGAVENVVVLPGDEEDKVYYVVRRTINGATVRFIERYATESQCTGFPGARHADAHVIYSGSAATVITGLGHLEGETVVAWAWNTSDTSGTDFGTLGAVTPTYTVSGGSITLPSAKENACVGLPFTADFKSAKLAYAAAAGTALEQKKRISQLGLILHNTHGQGVKFGQSFDTMDKLPQMYRGAAITADQVYDEFDEPTIPLPGKWDTDARLHLRAAAPRPCTVLGAVIGLATHDKA